MRVALLGGARVLDNQDTFQIGKRNHLAARRILWKAGMMIRHEEVGGTLPRTIHLDVGTGRLAVQQSLNLRELWLN